MQEIKADVLIVGGGIAGVCSALKAEEKVDNVYIVDKGFVGKTSHSALSTGGIIALRPEDDLAACIDDLVEVHENFIDRALAEYLLKNSYHYIKELETWGADFVKIDGNYFTYPSRGTRYLKDFLSTGHGEGNLQVAIKEALHQGVKILNRIYIANLLTDEERVVGAIGMDTRTGELYIFHAKATIIASNNPGFRGPYFACDLVGDGPMLAYCKGTELENAEFNMLNTGSPVFHFEGTGPAAAFGATFRDADGKPFMAEYHPELKDKADLPDLTRAMALEVRSGKGPMYYDFTTMSDEFWDMRLRRRKWSHHHLGRAKLEKWGIDNKKPEWMPAHQYSWVGIRVSFEGASNLPGLFAAGKARGGIGIGGLTGWHWCLCMGTGYLAGQAAGEYAKQVTGSKINQAYINDYQKALFGPLDKEAFVTSDQVLKEIQETVFPYDVMILKHRERLQKALDRICLIRDEKAPRMAASDIHNLVRVEETANILLNAEMFLRASLRRAESRGQHYREDFPNRDDTNWLKAVVVTKGLDGLMDLSVQALTVKRGWLL